MWDEILQWAKSWDKLTKVSAHNFKVYCKNIHSGRPIAEDNRGRERCLRLFNSRYARKSSSCHRCQEEEQRNRDETKERNDRNRPGEGRVASRRLSLESRSKICVASNDAVYRDRIRKCAKVSHGCRFYSESGATAVARMEECVGRSPNSDSFTGETNNTAKRRAYVRAQRAIVCNVNIS